jgi:hypothetical protein
MSSDVRKLLDGLDSNKWDDRFFVSMVGFISSVLKENDEGEGYDFKEKSLEENSEFIYDLIQNSDYSEKLRLELRDFMEVILSKNE